MVTSPTRPPAELAATLELAGGLAGSTPGAIELATDALVRDRSWERAAEDFDPAPRLWTAVVRAFLASPLGRSVPPAGAVGLDALTGPARSAVLLRDAERLTAAEIATIMDRPAQQVLTDLAAVPPGAHDDEIGTLAALAPSVDEVMARLGPARTRIRRSRRGRGALLALAVVMVLAAVVVPTVVLPRLPVEVRESGVWRYSHEVVLAPGWELVGRRIEADVETTMLQIPWLSDEPALCTVSIWVRGLRLDSAGANSEPIRVRQRPGALVTEVGNTVTLHWEYAPAAWATVGCHAAAAVDPAKLREIAAATRFREGRQLLPFTLSRLPTDYRIESVSEWAQPFNEAVGVGPVVVLLPPDDSYRAGIVIGPDLAENTDTPISRCLGTLRDVCVSAFQTDDQVPPNRALLDRTVVATIGYVGLAPAPADRSTWFDAADLPSR